MKAVGYHKSLPITEAESLIDVTVEKPAPGPRDLLVAVKAVSANPIDTKMRMRVQSGPSEPPRILGYDAAGVVEMVGREVTLFKPGDEVFYAGSISRPGTNAEFHLVDERIAGAKPRSLTFAQAAALPLTAITAWELLFDRFGVAPRKTPDGRALLIVGGAGGVGSIMIQIARRLTALTVIATASRPETRQWCTKLGAHHVIDHTRPLAEQLKAVGHPHVELIASLTGTDGHFPVYPDIIGPQGKIGMIDDPKDIDVGLLRRKAVSLHWESMFTRSLFGTPDMVAQHYLLNEIAALVDDGLIVTTMTSDLSPINATNLRQAHERIETATSIGKLVLHGW